jgi:hypothetical protein
MKKVLIVMIFGLILSACDSSSHKKTTYQITDWMVAGVTNPNTGDGALGWAKMVTYKDSIQYKEDTASNGDVTKKKSVVSDTFYYLQTPDFSCPVKDSTGKQINNPQNHQPVYYISWRNAQSISKNVLKPILEYPQSMVSQLNANQPKPDTAYKAPNMHVVSKDTARHSGK